jgi:thioredoxin reductase
MQTNIEGVFAVRDYTLKIFIELNIAISYGTIAAFNMEKYNPK